MFPVSILTSAGVTMGGSTIGSCVDAMAGCRSGRIAYVVVSDGGVAGVGETLRRVDWAHARIDGDNLCLEHEGGGLERFEKINRDCWPAR